MKYLLLASSLLIAVVGHAGLYRVGPNDTVNGYPLWYQDNNGLALDLCIPTSALQDDVCLTTPAPGDAANTFPFSFPDNWPDELFWFGADAVLDLDGNRAILVQAIEAAFGGAGTPNPGGQISFARIRLRFDAPLAGDYTVTYPYGQVEFTGLAAGEPVFYTVDIGIGAPGDFSGALGGEVGPFLTAVDAGGIPKPFHTVPNPDGSNSSFLADPLLETQVTGSPTGNNSFEISVVPADTLIAPKSWSTSLFALIGKVHTTPIGSPMKITSALYSRSSLAGDISIDVHATAAEGPTSQGAPVLTLGMVDLPSVKMAIQPGTISKYYGQSTVTGDNLNTTYKPNDVTVINSSDNPASSVRVPLVDRVTISKATIDIVSGDVVIEAVSSDLTVTQLSADIPGTGSFDLGTGGSFLGLNLPVPPETVTVSSTAGGSATANLVILCSGCRPAAFGPGAPLAVDDTNDCSIIGTPCIFDILANDGAEAVPGLVVLSTEPVHGIASVNVDGTVTYTPDFDGVKDSFTYTVDSIDSLSSNLATVSINPTGGNPPPPVVAEPDPEQLIVARAECRGGKNEWRVEGTSSLLTPHSVTIYEGSTAGGTVIAANVPVDNIGDWRMPKDSGPCVSVISIGSSEGGVIEGIGISVN